MKPLRSSLAGLLLATSLATPLAGFSPPAAAATGTVRVAVAGNFLAVLEELVATFSAERDVRVTVSGGSTGGLYAQIAAGAPFDLFFAADRETPARTIAAGYALAEDRRTYARGYLVLYGHQPLAGFGLTPLDGFNGRLVIANPATAPYGRAARYLLRQNGYWETLSDRTVRAGSVASAYSLVRSGSVDLGFVALASVLRDAVPESRYRKLPPAEYPPLHQDVVLLARARNNPAARELLAFVFSAEGRELIERSGYTLD